MLLAWTQRFLVSVRYIQKRTDFVVDSLLFILWCVELEVPQVFVGLCLVLKASDKNMVQSEFILSSPFLASEFTDCP